jgi:ketol-acid reductoisomerase
MGCSVMFLDENEVINSLFSELKAKKKTSKTIIEHFYLKGMEYVIEEIAYGNRFKRYKTNEQILSSQILQLENVWEVLNDLNEQLPKKLNGKESLLYLKSKYEKLQKIAENENEHDVFWAYEEVLDEINNLL